MPRKIPSYKVSTTKETAIKHILEGEIRLSKWSDELLNDSDLMTEGVCIAAVRMYPDNIKYVKEQTERLCLEAIRSENFYPEVMSFIGRQTEALCLEAIRRDCRSLFYIREQTEKVCLAAIRKNPVAISYCRNQTETLCLEAVMADYRALYYIRKQNPAICLAAVRADYRALQYVHEKMLDICIEGIAAGGIDALRYVDPTMIPVLYETDPDVFSAAIPEYRTLLAKTAESRCRELKRKRERGKEPLAFATRAELRVELERTLPKNIARTAPPDFVPHWADILFDVYRVVVDYGEYYPFDKKKVAFVEPGVCAVFSRETGRSGIINIRVTLSDDEVRKDVVSVMAKPVDIVLKCMEMYDPCWLHA